MTGSVQAFHYQTQSADIVDELNFCLGTEFHADLLIHCIGGCITAHRVVLAATSPFLTMLLEGPLGLPCDLLLPDVRYSDMKKLVEFLYTGKLATLQEEVNGLLELMELLQIFPGLLPSFVPTETEGRTVAAAGSKIPVNSKTEQSFGVLEKAELWNMNERSEHWNVRTGQWDAGKTTEHQWKQSSAVENFPEHFLEMPEVGDCEVNDLSDKDLGEAGVCRQGLDSEPGPSTSRTQPYECPMDLCHVMFDTGLALKRHVAVCHSQPFICPQASCHVTYHSGSGLWRHLESAHSRKQGFQCTVCGKTFRSFVYFQCHKHEEHQPERSAFECYLCGSKFVNRNSIARHLTLEHFQTSVKSHTCKQCGKTFKRKDMCLRHAATHTPQKTAECFVCKAKFARKDGVDRHMKRAHPWFSSEQKLML